MTTLRLLGHVKLPAHPPGGGFDHAAVHASSSSLYVAHTSNDAIDVLDCSRDEYRSTIPGLKGVAGVLVDDTRDLVFTSNRAEDTVGIFRVGHEDDVLKVGVGHRPNGLAYDPTRHVLLAANVGDPKLPDSTTVSFVDVDAGSLVSNLTLPGRPRWALFDAASDRFFVNIADPAVIVSIDPRDRSRVFRSYPVPVNGPHGLEMDSPRERLFCACDEGKLVTVDSNSGKVLAVTGLSGPPDVIFFNPAFGRLYVAVGNPGVIDLLDVEKMRRSGSEQTERGAHTLAFDATRDKVYAFLPNTHRAAVYQDSEERTE